MSCSWSEKGLLKDVGVGESSSSLLLDFGSPEHVPDDNEGSMLS